MLEGDTLNFGQLQFTVYATPGHTVGHIIFLLEAGSFGAPPSVFSGDHIFLAGIGKQPFTFTTSDLFYTGCVGKDGSRVTQT